MRVRVSATLDLPLDKDVMTGGVERSTPVIKPQKRLPPSVSVLVSWRFLDLARAREASLHECFSSFRIFVALKGNRSSDFGLE